MSFLEYLTHKDSGSEWIGEIPQHWSASPLKRAFRIEGGSTPPPDDANWDGDIAWITPADLSGLSSLFLDESKRTITAKGLASCGTKLLPAGSLILSTRAPIGSLGIGLVSMCTNQGCKGLVPNANASAAYFAFVLLTAREELNNRGRGSTFLEISGDELSRFSVPLPPFKEQTQIARFLDHETARIDGLIEEQQRLIELLKEKRQAVISHAVTKGLDPTVPMKDSGVEWLGQVPAHWNITRSKFVFRLVSGYAFKSEFFQKNGDGEKVLITPGSFDELGKLYFSEKSTVQYEGEWQSQFELKVGDLVMVLTDLSYKKLILGRAAFVDRDDALLNQRIAKVVISPNVDNNYLWLAINSEVMREQLKLTASGATVFHTSTEKVGDCWMALPPENEQIETTAFVEKFHFELDNLIQQVIEAVGLLRERRSAVISAAVTGKIDVRGWKPPAIARSGELAEEAV